MIIKSSFYKKKASTIVQDFFRRTTAHAYLCASAYRIYCSFKRLFLVKGRRLQLAKLVKRIPRFVYYSETFSSLSLCRDVHFITVIVLQRPAIDKRFYVLAAVLICNATQQGRIQKAWWGPTRDGRKRGFEAPKAPRPRH